MTDDRTGSDRAQPADVLVIFGITGDLARVMTFRSLYRLESAGSSSAESSASRSTTGRSSTSSQHARDSIVATGEPSSTRTSSSASPTSSPTSTATSRTPPTYAEWRRRSRGSEAAGLLPRDPAVALRHGRRRPRRRRADRERRVVVEKPFGHDLASARELNEELHALIDESQLYRIDHFLGKMAVEDILYLRFANTSSSRSGTVSTSCVQITMGEDFGIADRGNFYDPVGAMRDVVQNHLLQVLAWSRWSRRPGEASA